MRKSAGTAIVATFLLLVVLVGWSQASSGSDRDPGSAAESDKRDGSTGRHGADVSRAAHECPSGPGHGACVRDVARGDRDKPDKGHEADTKAERDADKAEAKAERDADKAEAKAERDADRADRDEDDEDDDPPDEDD